MSILDRYIARQYLINIVVLLTLLGGFVVLVDASLNLARNLEVAGEVLRAAGEQDPSSVRKFLAAIVFIINLWWPRLLQLFNYLNALVLIAAMGFTFAQLVRSREIVAALAGGISLYRLLRPVLVVAALFLMIQVANQELVIPRIAPLILRSNTEVVKRDLSGFTVTLVPDSAGRLWSAAEFIPPSAEPDEQGQPRPGVLKGVQIWERDDSGRATWRISADRATYRPGLGAWELTGVSTLPLAITATSDGASSARPRMTASGLPITAPANASTSASASSHASTTPSAGPTPSAGTTPSAGGERTTTRQITTDLDPTALVADHYKAFSQLLSWSQLVSTASSPAVKPEIREQFARLAWGRGALLLCTMLSILVSAPFFLMREPANMVLQSLKCAPVAIGSVVGSIIGTAVAIPGLPIQLGVLIPVLALIPMVIASLTSMKS